MHWHDWNDAAFERARERACPVLLFLRASWCRWCEELEEEVLGSQPVSNFLSEHFVCIRVDKDRRPDIDSRYRKGGWPSLVYLDADGEQLAADNYVDEAEFLEHLNTVVELFPARAAEIGPILNPPPAPITIDDPSESRVRKKREAKLSMELVDDVLATLKETADPVHGGWGKRHKFPHPEALHFAIVRWSQTGDRDTLDLVLRTLRRMQAGEIYDKVEGGFYRYATHADWSVPQHEKMLDSNAQRLLAYVEAYQALGEDSFKTTAIGILEWMHSTLLDPETRAFRGSQDADPEYAHLKTLELRTKHGAPECDPTIFTNWNAMAVCSLLKSAVVLDEDRYRDQALATLDFLMTALFDERWGMSHYWDGAPNLPGMLTDQAYTLRALIEAMHYAGENRYMEPAKAIAHLAIEHLQAEDGSFSDKRHDPAARGGLRERNTSILDNAVMAEALLRLACMTREPVFEEHARMALASFLKDYKRYGHFVAGYGRAVDLLFHAPVHVTIVGPKGADRTRALRTAALKPYVASRIVQTIDPVAEPALFERCGLPEPGDAVARAYVDQGRESYAETSKPERLAALMARTERSN